MKKVFYFVVLATLLYACKQSAPTATPSVADILRTGRWKVASGTVTLKKPNGLDTTLNYMPFIPPCHTDDYIKFDSLNTGATFPGAVSCFASEPDSISFQYRLYNNDQNIDILNVFNFFYTVVETIQLPYFFDTLSTSPLRLDTLADSPLVVLDTTWLVKFDSAYVVGNGAVYGGVNIYDAAFSNFSQAGFTLTFNFYGTYPDSTGGHEGGPPNNTPPIMRPDTLKFILNYVNF